MSTLFSWYLSRSNSNLDPWIVIGMWIWSSPWWHWFQPILIVGSKLGFLAPPKIDFGSNLVKLGKSSQNYPRSLILMQNYEKCCFVRVLTLLDLWLNLGLTRAILVILVEKGTSGAPVPKWVAPCCFGCSRGLMGRKWYFGFFKVRHANWGRIKYGISTSRAQAFILYNELKLENHL